MRTYSYLVLDKNGEVVAICPRKVLAEKKAAGIGGTVHKFRDAGFDRRS